MRPLQTEQCSICATFYLPDKGSWALLWRKQNFCRYFTSWFYRCDRRCLPIRCFWWTIEVEDITVQINGINTNANGYYVVGLAQTDATPDTNAVDKVALFYYDDGTAVKNTSGNAVSRSVSGSEAYFDGLDLVIDDGDSTLIEVRTDLRGMDDQDSSQTARSGMAFQVNLDVDVANDKATIRGADSGEELTGANIDDTGLGNADAVYVFNNKVIATETASQPSTTLTTGLKKELLKFTSTVLVIPVTNHSCPAS